MKFQNFNCIFSNFLFYRKSFRQICEEVVFVAGDASENSRISDRAAAAAKGGDADQCVVAPTVQHDQRTAAVTLKMKIVWGWSFASIFFCT
jgi:hypothetical protein